MQFSDRMSSIKPAMTLAINAKALELKEQGIMVTSLAVGEPDFPTPAHICEAAKAAIDANFCRYTAVPGIPDLRKAICDYMQNHYDLALKPENVLASAGGKHCIFNYIMAVINPGDEVIIPAPYWLSYPDITRIAGGVPVFVKADASANFKITAEQLKAAITPRTKLFILNSPNNPTGAVYNAEELDALMQVALSAGIMILCDEIYEQLVFEPAVMASASKYLAQYPEQVSIIGGVSKTFAMTGWRMGYVIAHPQLIKKISTIQGQSTSNICSITQKAALAALTGDMTCVAEMRAAFKRRRDMALAIIDKWSFAVCPHPDGAFYLFIDVHKCFGGKIDGSAKLCEYLLEKAHVAMTPGIAFGDDNCIRISYAIADEELKSAINRIGDALAELADANN